MPNIKKILQNARAAGVRLPYQPARSRMASTPVAGSQIFKAPAAQNGSQAGTKAAYVLAPVIPSLAADIIQQDISHTLHSNRLDRARKNFTDFGIPPSAIETGKIFLALYQTDNTKGKKGNLLYVAQHAYVPARISEMFQDALAERHAYEMFTQMNLPPEQLRLVVVATPPVDAATGKVSWIYETGHRRAADTLYSNKSKIGEIVGSDALQTFNALQQNWDVLFDQTGLNPAVNRLLITGHKAAQPSP